MDYKYIDRYINEVRNISKELGYDENEFIFKTQGIRSDHEEIRRKRANTGTNVDVLSDGGSSRQSSGLRAGTRGRNGKKSSEESRLFEQPDSGLSDGELVGDRDEISDEGRRDRRLNANEKDAQSVAEGGKDVRFSLSDGGYEDGYGEKNPSDELGRLDNSSESEGERPASVVGVGQIQSKTSNTPHTKRIHRSGVSARTLTSSGLTAEQAALREENLADLRYSLSSDTYSTHKIIEEKAMDIGDESFIEAAKENTKQVQRYVRLKNDLHKRLTNAKRQMTKSKAPQVNKIAVAKVNQEY